MQHDLPSPTTITACTVIAVGGMLEHNVYELGPAFLLSPETLLPVALYAVLVVLAGRERSGTAVRTVLVVWVLLNLVGGGVLSVLPLAILSFVPEQSIGHYATHVVYAVAQLPLLLIALQVVRHGDAASAAATR